ncbi:hypothetical protein, partial [Serratia marcescens]|uniref:hypothetical protein n=1 Tax=Serratia marcescens TaxID=615 RepID=UPI00281456CE
WHHNDPNFIEGVFIGNELKTTTSQVQTFLTWATTLTISKPIVCCMHVLQQNKVENQANKIRLDKDYNNHGMESK